MSPSKNKITVDDLRGMALFSDLDDGKLKKISAIARFEEAPAGTLLLREGDLADTVRVLVRGRVSLTINVPGRRDAILATLSRGQLLGWSALIPGSRWAASARALKACTTVAVPGTDLLSVCKRDSELGYHVMKNAMGAVAERLAETRLLVLDMFGETDE